MADIGWFCGSSMADEDLTKVEKDLVFCSFDCWDPLFFFSNRLRISFILSVLKQIFIV